MSLRSLRMRSLGDIWRGSTAFATVRRVRGGRPDARQVAEADADRYAGESPRWRLVDRLRHRWDIYRRDAGELGAVHATLLAIRNGIETPMLGIEGRRGVLGPAHRAHQDHTVERNRAAWSGWDWRERGEEWTPSKDWKQALVAEVLRPTLPPGGTLLEIGPGAGRWTEYLIEHGDHLIAVDLSARVLELCRDRFDDNESITYVENDGRTLPDVAEASVDGVWSFDAFVHIGPLDVASYLSEIARVLRPGGVGVVHHAGRRDLRAWRSPMSAPLFASLSRERGLAVERQFDSWGDGRYDVRKHRDVITVVRKPV
jgi:ubiquinone/menaquinone biosynthesis C-methylase UbiE